MNNETEIESRRSEVRIKKTEIDSRRSGVSNKQTYIESRGLEVMNKETKTEVRGPGVRKKPRMRFRSGDQELGARIQRLMDVPKIKIANQYTKSRTKFY